MNLILFYEKDEIVVLFALLSNISEHIRVLVFYFILIKHVETSTVAWWMLIRETCLTVREKVFQLMILTDFQKSRKFSMFFMYVHQWNPRFLIQFL